MALGGGARLALGGAVGILAASLYAPIRGHEWLSWDDFVYITENPYIPLGFSKDGIEWAFSSFYQANWFPLTWLSWMLDYELHGFDSGAFLTTNLVLHAVASVLLFAALDRLTGAPLRSAFAAAVFAVHPLHVESVAWAAARKDSLSGVFFLLALWIHAGRPSGVRRAGVAACFALGFLAKPTVITLPFVLLLLDDWPLARTRDPGHPERWDRARVRACILRLLPLFGLAIALALVTFLAQRSGGTVQDLEALPIGWRIKNALVSYVAYLGAFVWPEPLAFFYPHRGDEITWTTAAGAAIGLLAVTIGVLRQAPRRGYLMLGWLWFVGMLLPVIGLVQIGAQARADRYMYLPLIGLSIAGTWAAAELVRGPRRRLVLGAAGAVTLVALAWRSGEQIETWHDSVSLYEHGLAVTRDNHVAHAHLGGALLARGRTREAIVQYEAALEQSPDYMRVANNLAWLLATQPDPALRDPERAIELGHLAARLSGQEDAAILDTLAAALASAGRYAEATQVLERAVELADLAGDASLTEALVRRERLYRAGTPYRDDPAAR